MGLKQLVHQVIGFALPPRCASCGTIVEADHRLCGPCWNQLEFLAGPGCELCNTPVPVKEMVCGACLATPPQHDGIRAAVIYGDVSRAMVLKLKHGNRPGVARSIGQHMARLTEGLDGALIAPVPLHRWRLWFRGYNQALLIAQNLSRIPGAKTEPQLLLRTKATPMLRGLGKTERIKAMRGAFQINPAFRENVKGVTICLVDDVYTSGATMNACAALLKRAGAEKVIGLCWARVIDREHH